MSRILSIYGLAAVLVLPLLGLAHGAGAARRHAPEVARYSGQTGGIGWIKTTIDPASLDVLRDRLAKPEVRSGTVRG
jgi:hypothetical protein